MIGKKSVMTAAVFLLGGYAVMPYVTVWHLMTALRAGDTRALEASVDWDAVRAGLKQDIAEGIVGDFAGDPQPAPTTVVTSGTAANARISNAMASESGTTNKPEGTVAGGGLPPFGASFLNGIAGTMVDREVTPQHLATLMRQLGPAEADAGSAVPLGNIRHAFFDGPTSFELQVLCPGQDPDDQPLRVRLELHAGAWRVTRAWVPQDLIDLANART